MTPKFIKWFELHYSAGMAAWTIFITFGGSGILTFLATVTDYFSVYSPFLYGFIFLFSAFTIIVMIYIFEYSKEKTSRSQLYRTLANAKSSINPLDDIFERKRINLVDFFSPFYDQAANKTFIECELIGPATIILIGFAHLSHTNFIMCDFVIVDENSTAFSGIGFRDVTMKHCKIYQATILVTANQAHAFSSMGSAKFLNQSMMNRNPPSSQ